jgi:transglutaminase-like putative cysteine protease
MRIRIAHEIVHRFAPPARTINQNLRLTPHGFDSQYVLRWRIGVDLDGALRQGDDAHGNLLSSFSHHGTIERLTVTAAGEIETTDTAGVVRGTIERLPADMYLRESPLARANGALGDFAAQAAAAAADTLDAMHRLMSALHREMTYEPEPADAADTAAEAFALRRGRASDLAHIFIACARSLGVPARFICGYRAPDEEGEGAGVHAWAEAHVPRLGWVAFDPTDSVCADERYVRVAVGFDGRDGAMTRAAHAGGEEQVETAVWIEQAGAQGQG